MAKPPPDDPDMMSTQNTRTLATAQIPDMGELHLLRAMLQQAMTDAMKHCRCKNRWCKHGMIMVEAREWLDDGATHPFSFRFICQVLGLDADAVRRRVGY